MNIEIDPKELGKRIKEARIKANMTQTQLCQKTGISTTQLSAYENGNKNAGLSTLARIAIATGRTIDDIYFGDKTTKPVSAATDRGTLIVNCVNALFDNGVITLIPEKEKNNFVYEGYEYVFRIGFGNYTNFLDDMLKQLRDFDKKKFSYPDPEDFRKQIIASTAKQINDDIEEQKEKEERKRKIASLF